MPSSRITVWVGIWVAQRLPITTVRTYQYLNCFLSASRGCVPAVSCVDKVDPAGCKASSWGEQGNICKCEKTGGEKRLVKHVTTMCISLLIMLVSKWNEMKNDPRRTILAGSFARNLCNCVSLHTVRRFHQPNKKFSKTLKLHKKQQKKTATGWLPTIVRSPGSAPPYLERPMKTKSQWGYYTWFLFPRYIPTYQGLM